MNLIMPMAGAGSRFYKNGYKVPKPIIELQGEPFFFWAVQSIKKFIPVKNLIFVVLKDHIESFNIDSLIRSKFPEAKMVVIPEVLNGPVLTCLESLKEIENDFPVLFNDVDHLFYSDALVKELEGQKEIDYSGGFLTFFSNNPAYSYCKLNDENNVIETKEKQVISTNAITGAYLFKNASLFKQAAEKYLTNCNYPEYFMSGVYNVLIKQQEKVKHFPTELHLSFGTPDELEKVNQNHLIKFFR